MKVISGISTNSFRVVLVCYIFLLIACNEKSAKNVETTTASAGESHLINNTPMKEFLMNDNSHNILNKSELSNGLDNYFLNQEDNSVISPYGIIKALQLVAGGAAQSSKNQLDMLMNSAELAATLTASKLQPMDNIDGIWFNKTLIAYGDEQNLKDSYREFAKREFNASELHLNDIQKRSKLDEEIASASNGRLRLPQMPSVETLSIYIVVLNYFSDKWKFSFDKTKSTPGLFYNLDGEDIVVTKMNLNGEFQYISDEKHQIVSLPFEDSQFDAIVILPEKDIKLDIDIQAALTALDNSGKKILINLSLPRFKAEFDQSLKPSLMKAGVRDLFSPHTADFSNMVKRAEGMHVSDIIHRAAIEVSEEGATAASTTIVSLFGSLPPPTAEVTFNVDHAFYFVIRSRDHNQVLFIAKMTSFQDE